MKNTKRSFLYSVLSLVLCISMLMGTTYAWFTDNANSSNNIITSGNLDIEMYWTDDMTSGEWNNAENDSAGAVFAYDNWEPGYTEVRYIKIVNAGSLAFRYRMTIDPEGVIGKLAEVIDVYYIENITENLKGREALANLNPVSTLVGVIEGNLSSDGVLLPKEAESPLYTSGETIIAVAMKMQEDAGNEYQNESIGDGFSINLLATQFNWESDSFGDKYDENATFPELELPAEMSATVTPTADGKVPAGGVTMQNKDGSVRVTVPAGVKLAPGVKKLTAKVLEMDESQANVVLGKDEILRSLDVHVEGIAQDNTVPAVIWIDRALMTGLNLGNYQLYHVEKGVSNPMSLVTDSPNAHNNFTYDPATGDVTLAMATFSEVAIVADTEKAWEGNFDYSWYVAENGEYTIANADQLAAFGAIVGGMNGQTADSFAGKTVKLLSDINLGDSEAENNPDLIFYPIGYYNSEKSYDKVSGGEVTSSVSSFKGAFDGNGHTIANFYQNTWEMFGDYNDGYSGTPNHYKDAMGLFGYVNGGTVKNLTVKNFSSDGEFTPTGVIAAYAVNAAFENIAIVDCNPRVYNTGNGGIVGIGGNSNDPDTYELTFTNITIDNSNKITALWGSWDVACGGLVGMFQGAGHAHMTNCHVAAQIDVYNDVCGNYQYYWYRYSGMMIGTNKNMITDENGYTVPETSKFHAKDCTVHFGEWNDYYYCELVANSPASYTHDHQFSRLEQKGSLDEIKSGDAWKKAGNFLLISGDTKTCYHIVEKDGVLQQHLHTDAGEETVNGETVLKEDKQIVYLPFNQLFTGYGWGVKHIPVYNGEDYAFEGITILDREYADSVVKFDKDDGAKDSFTTGTIVTIGELFKTAGIANDITIKQENVQVTVSPVYGTNSTAGATYAADLTDWTKGTLTFSGLGAATITITDYYFCIPTTITITVTEPDSVVKFDSKFTNDYFYRVGNQNSVALGSLFAAKDGVTIGNVTVTVKTTQGNASGTYTANTSDWTKGTIQFSGTGIVEVTIQDDNYCAPTTLDLEVVDAVNATSAVSATKNNVVLLNDVNLHTIEVSNGYTLYGNGFKMTAKSDVMYDAMGVGFVTLKNGTLDNVQIICPDFSYAIIYNNQIKDNDNTAKPSDSSNDARGNVRSAVMADGNSKIVNSYIHGGRAAIFLRSGNLVVDGSTISGGAAANIHALSAQSLTLRNATLIQKPFKATVHDTSKTLMGFSGLFECDESGNSTPLILEGTLIQDAWINESYQQYVPSEASSIIGAALKKNEYLHDLDGDGTKESLNLGFAYIPQSVSGVTEINVKDNRTDIATVPYEVVEVKNTIASAKVYSYKNDEGTSDDFIDVKDFAPFAQGVTSPKISFNDTNADRVFETVFDSSDNRWESTLTVNLDNEDYQFSFTNLLVQKYGENLTYTVNIAGGAAVDTSNPIALTASGVTEYVLTVSDREPIYTVYFILTATKTSIPEPEVADTTGGTPLLVVKSKNSDWSCAIPALEGIKIKYYTSAGNSVTLDLATLTPTSTGKQNGTNNYWVTTKDGYTLKVTCGYIHDTKQIYGMPVVVNNDGNKMYFTISSTNGYVSTSTAARTVTLTYEFTDPNGKTLTFSKTWQFNYADYKNGKQYSYSDFVNGTLKEASSGGGCVTPDTLVTLADGTQVRVDSLTGNEELLVWNHQTGSFESVPVAYIVNHNEEIRNELITKLYFSDGSSIKIIGEHVFYDATLNRYIALTAENAKEFIGHQFVGVNADNDALTSITLIDIEQYMEETSVYEVVSYQHLTCFTNNVLSTSAYLDKLLNIFDIDPDTMTYSAEKVQEDIATYGLYTYEDFEGLITEEAFELYNAQYLKIAVGKGYITWDDILALIDIYFDVDVQPI